MKYEPDRLLTPEEMQEYRKTPEGRKLLLAYFTSARVAYGMQKIFEMLNVIPNPEVQYACCEQMYDCLMRVPICQILDWCGQVVSWKETEFHEGEA